MSAVADVFKSLFDRFAEFFDILDLSFFLSGMVCLGGLAFLSLKLGFPLGWIPLNLAGFLGVLVVSYVLGVLCYASSRQILRMRRRKKALLFKIDDIVRSHKLQEDPRVNEYLASIEALEADGTAALAVRERLYTLLWARIRQDEALRPSFTLVRRYWVLTAVCNGLGTALILWIVALAVQIWQANQGGAENPLQQTVVGSLGIVLLALGIRACWEESDTFKRYQAEELVATLAYQAQEEAKKAVEDKEGDRKKVEEPPPAETVFDQFADLMKDLIRRSSR